MCLLLHQLLGGTYTLCLNSDIIVGKAPNYSQLLTHNNALLVVISSKKIVWGVFA